jgi:signal transduction histidine kinase
MKLELQEEEFKSVWGKPAELVDAILPPLLEEGRQNEVTVTVEYPLESFIACFDVNGMDQIVTNLVDNAIRFSKPGGEVLVRIGIDSDVWTLQVSDSGSGIDSSELPYLFDRFHRHEYTVATDLGIGLAIVKHFTELHNGVISVWSKRDSGTKFVLRFPISG